MYYSSAHFNQVNDTYNSERRKFEKLARDSRAAARERQTYRDYIDQFERYSKLGYIGPERRLSWIETLQDVNRVLKLPVLKYAISPRQPLELKNTGFDLDEKVTVYESVMQLHLGLLHGGDLFVFLSELKKRASGLFEVRSCDLILASSELHFDTEKPNINASCQLAWYTIGIAAENGPLEP